MPAFADAVVKTVLEPRLDCPVYTVVPADPARRHVYTTAVGGQDIDPRFRLVRASVQVQAVDTDYLRAFELSLAAHEALMDAERADEVTDFGVVSRVDVWETAVRHSLQRAPNDEWRFMSFYGITIS